ncbi:DUF4123 domain-containing protein [Pseudomonas sp. OIL-1]|nr:DUF4123 domain-containing protein [Pseudomonas sp. OIL-1]
MSGITSVAEPAKIWITEQHRMDRDLFMVIDRLAEPDPIPMLFAAGVMDEYINLYQGTEWDEMAEIGPWLVKLPAGQAEAIAGFLETPQRNWGWLASATELKLSTFAAHWRERMVIKEQGTTALYRFQDNRVIAHHLASLTADQLPLLLGPACAILCWHGETWQATNNSAPAQYISPLDRPWLDVPEPAEVLRGIRRKNLQQWLWEQHPVATTRLASTEPLLPWLDRQLDKAEQWRWEESEQIKFLLHHQLDPKLANAPFWSARNEEPPEKHYQRCQRDIARQTRSQA